jgi:hypothetical protein
MPACKRPLPSKRSSHTPAAVSRSGPVCSAAPSFDGQLGLHVARCLGFCRVASRRHVVPGRGTFGSALCMCLPSLVPSCDTTLTSRLHFVAPPRSALLRPCKCALSSSPGGGSALTACLPLAKFSPRPASSSAQASNASDSAVAALSRANEFDAGGVLGGGRFGICGQQPSLTPVTFLLSANDHPLASRVATGYQYEN